MTQKTNKTFLALSAAAMELGIGSHVAQAVSMQEETTMGYQYSQYSENDLPANKHSGQGSRERYEIEVHQFYAKTPVTTNTELTFNAATETMSGASPWFVKEGDDGNAVQVMSGATIEEERNDASVALKTYFSTAALSLSLAHSDENDYQSLSASVGSSYTFNNKQTTLEAGIARSDDKIEPTDSNIYKTRPVKEDKSSNSIVFGLSHIFNKKFLMSASFGYASYEGFLSDPYKNVSVSGAYIADSRPKEKDQYSWTFLTRTYFENLNAALHADFRYYDNNWGIDSKTAEIGWYQNIGKTWQLVPKVRYYTQTSAIFYQPFYTTTRTDGFHSSDYRLSEFDAVSTKLKLSKKFDIVTAHLAYENYQSSGDSPSLVEFSRLSLGFQFKF